jgi:hypothetical protein
MNKCRKNIMMHNEFDYPIFSVMDRPVVYKNQTRPGLYYIESDLYLPIEGNGWYYYPMVSYLLTNNLIKKQVRFCNTQSDVCNLCTRKDGNLTTQSVPEEKSINYADQLIELATDYIDLRIRFSLLSACGHDTVVLPVSTGADRRSFPHSLFHFHCSPRISLVFVYM